MASKGTFVRIMKNEADRNAIMDIFKVIDEATKTFQVNLTSYQIIANLLIRSIQLYNELTTGRQVNDIHYEIKVNIKIFY